MLDCTDTSKLINNEKGDRRGFILLSLLTKLHLECLKQIQSGGRSKFPEDQENFLFDKIKAEVKNLKSQLVQLDAKHLKLIELALIDYKNLGDIILNKQNLLEFLISSYKAISETILEKEMPPETLQETLNEKESRKVELLQKWKETISKFNKDEKIKVLLDEAILSKVNKYLDIRGDAESLYEIYSTIDSCKKYFEKKGTTIEEKRLVLQTVLQKVGEYLKSTLDTPNLSDGTRKSLELEQLPIKLLTDFRDQIVHYQVFSLELDGRDITKLLDEGLVPIKEFVYNKIIGMEKDFIQDLVKEKTSGIGDKNVKELNSYAGEGITELIKGIEQIKGRENSKYNSMDDKSKRLVDEIYGSALQMRSRDFPSQSEGVSKIKLDAKKLEIIEKCTGKSESKVNKKVNDELNSWNLGLSQYLSDVSKIEEVVHYLQYGIPSVVNKKKEADVVLNNFLSSTEVLDKITIFDNDQRVPLKGQLEQYFDLQSFREKLLYSEFRGIKKVSLVNLLNSVNVDSGNKRALLKFLKSSNQNQGSPHDFITPDRYEELVKGLNLTPKSEEKLLSYSVEWRRNKCINLLKSNPTALKVICDSITEGKVIPDRVFKNLAYQYKPKGEGNTDTEKRAISLQQSIESEVGNLYLREVKKKIDVLGRLHHPDAVQMQFISIYSLLDRTRKNGDDPFLIRKLRNHLAHSEQSELFRGQFLQLIEGAVKKIDISKEVTLSSFNKAVSDAQSQLRLSEIKEVVGETGTKSNSGFSKGNLNHCGSRGSARRARSITECLFSKEDVEKFSKGKVDENNVDKVIIDSEKFLTYVKSSQDEAKNAQLIKFIGDKSIEGDYRYLVNRVVQEQGYERYIQNERVKDLYGGILQKDVGSTKNSKLKGRLINAAGRIQLIRGIHGTVVSCADGDSIDCGLSVSGMAWSFASQPIENVIVKIAPKIVKSAGQFVGKMVPGTLGRQAQFAVAFTGAKIGSKIAKGVAGAVGGIFDIIDISRSASNLVDCKKREDSDNPCGKKEIRDEIVSMSFSSVSFVAGVALTAAGMPVVGIAIGFALMVGQGVYSGVSNIIEYEEKYDTTHDENWRIFWHTFAFQPIPLDVQHLAERKEVVNSLAKEVWKMLNNVPDNVVAYGVGLGKVSGGTLRPDHATIMMNTERADIRSLSRVIPDDIEGADMICLPKITNQDYEKGITSFVPSAKHYCKNALIIADKSKSMQSNKTVVFDLRNVNFGNIVGSKKWNNNFLIFEGSEKIIGVSNIVNRFVLTNSRFVGQIIMGINSTNVFDLSQIEDSVVRVNPVDSIISTIFQTLDYAKLEVGINQCITNYVNTIRYHYIGRHNKVDIVSCTTSTGDFIDCDTIIDSCGGNNDKQRDTIANCNKVVIAPYTDVLGKDGNYIFYVQSKGYKGKNLHSEIDVEGTGIVIFPENDLLNDCDNITYSSDTNTLSLRIVLGQNNRYTLDIKNYRKQGIIQPNFTLVDINGSNVVPKIREFGIRKINSFELHSEHSLDSLDNVKTHYKKIIGNNKSYEVFTVIRNKTQSQDDSKFQKMVFGSFGDDVINLDQGTIFAKGGEGSDLYFVSGDMDSEKVKIDNNSDDRSLDAISMPEVPEKFLMQGCDLYLDHNGTDIQVENYLKDNGYRHIAFVNGKGESFIPYIQSISCVGSSEENGKLVPFFHATPTQNMFVLPKGFQGDSVVIDSRPEEIERYKDRDDLLLVREGGIPFIIKVENFYNDRGGWENVNFLLWNDGNFSPYSGLYQKVSEVIDYQDKLKSDYEESFKEYVVDFTQSVNITHNQNDTLTSLEEDEKRIGVMILKNITPDRIQVSSSGRDLVFSDKVSNNVINIKNWSDSESYRISMLEFDLGLEPILIRRLDQFTLSNIEEIRNLVDKVSEICQSNAVCETNIEAENCNVQVSLHCAAASGQLDVVEKLVKELALADVNVKDSTGWTPLHYAAANGKLNVVRYLIGKVASVDVRGDLEQTPLLLAVENGRLDVVKYLIEEKEAYINTRDKFWITPLHLAASNGRLGVVKYLIEEKEAYINTRDKFWITPLHLAASNGRLGVVKYLIEEKEADINIRDKFWITPLHLAAENGELDVVEYITEKGSSTNVRDQSRTSPLHLAARNGRLDVVKYLIEKGADVDIRNKFGTMPVHLAAKNGELDVVEYIIREWGDFNAYDWLGRVPLHYAAEGGKLDMVKYIIEKGANVNIKSKAREISLSVIDENNELEELEYFTKKRANVNVEDDFGFTPLHLAAENGKLNVVRYLIEEKHADINIKDNLGRTPLSLADDMMYYDVVEYLDKELNERKEIPKQRNRRHHHGDHDRHHLSRKPRATDSINQPEIVASSGARSSSWINDLFGWVKNSIGGLLGSRTALSKETSSTPSSISQVDAKMDVNGTIMLLDVLIRKVTDQKYISTVDQSISPLEAQGYALNITNGFKKVVEQAALKSGISMHRLDIDYMGMQKEITRKVMSGKFNEISGILNSYVEKACSSREVGCPGKLSSKKFDKFMVEFNSGLLNQSIEQILHNRDGRLKVDDAKQMSLEPQSYLSNSSVQGHSKVSTCLSDIGVTKLVNNLSR